MNEDYFDNLKCPVTGRDDLIDDCYIEIQFGYGSDKDMWTYKFGPVHDMVGKGILDLIQSYMDTAKPPVARSVDEFGVDTLAECAEKSNAEWDAMTDEERRQMKIKWGIINEDE